MIGYGYAYYYYSYCPYKYLYAALSINLHILYFFLAHIPNAMAIKKKWNENKNTQPIALSHYIP